MQQQESCHMCCYHSKQYVAPTFPCKTAILDEPMVAKLDNKSLSRTGIEGSLPCSQQLAIGLYPESYLSSICHSIDPDLNFDITFPSASWRFLMLFSLQGFQHTYVKFGVYCTSPLYVLMCVFHSPSINCVNLLKIKFHLNCIHRYSSNLAVNTSSRL